MKENGHFAAKEIAENDTRVIRKLIWSLVPAQASATTFTLINTLANSVIVGRYFGSEALAAIGFVGPLTMLGDAVSSLLSTGSSILCGKAIGKGNKEEIQRIFNTALFTSAFFAVLISLVFLFFSRPLTILLGVTGTDIDATAAYILGIGAGVGFSILSLCLTTFLQLERMDKMYGLMSAIALIFNVFGNLANILIFHWGILGIGLFSSVSNVISVLIALPYILKKGKLFHISLRAFDFKLFGEIIRTGSPSTIRTLSCVVQGWVINQFVYTLGGTTGMAAMSVADNCTELVSNIIEPSYSNVSTTVINLLVGHRDTDSLKKITRILVSYVFPLYAVSYVLISIVFGKPIVLLFGAEAAELSLYVTTFRIYALYLFFEMLLSPIIAIYQAVGKIRTINIVTVICSAIMPVVLAFAFGNMFGFYYIVSFSSLLSIISILAYVVIYIAKKHKIPSPFGICVIPDTLAVPEEDRIVESISNIDEVIAASKLVIEFCRNKGLSEKTAYFAGLCIEEMGTDTIMNRIKSKKDAIDLRVFYENEHIRIMFRDSCPHFDPNEWLALCQPEDAIRSLGIRMVSKIAGEMTYVNSLGLNVLIIEDYKTKAI